METQVKNVLILGGYGFLGTNVMKYAEVHYPQYRFIVFDRYDSHPACIKFSNVISAYCGDFTDSILIERIFNENHIDYVFHSLSTTVPASSFNAPFDVESNLLPTLNVLNLMIQNNVRDIVYLSSGGAIYGTRNDRPHKESDDVFPISSYGVVKLAIEKYLMQYSQLYGIRPLILRLSNPYGPYHYSTKQGVINIAMTKALHHDTIQIWGDGNGKKDYFYVEDYADILFQLLAKDIHNEVINIGSGKLLSVNEIIDTIRQWIPDINVEFVEEVQFDAKHFALDTSKLHQVLPDYTFTPLNVGLQKTYDWTMGNI